MFKTRTIIIIVSLLVAGCGDNDRYELSKDAAGNTVRLDKKTGEIAIVQGSKLKILKDTRTLEAERERQESLAKPRYWKGVDNPNLGVNFSLKTAWRDGEMFYTFSVTDLAHNNALLEYLQAEKGSKEEKDSKAKLASITTGAISARLQRAASHTPFTIHLYDENETKLREFVVARLVRIVDEKGKALSFQYESSISLSVDLYSQLKTFTVQWVGR